jgi:dolichol-phosphate mannosyltransferase
LKTTLVIPTYNEIENIQRIIPKIFSQNIDQIDVLVVDDNSPDGTAQACEQMAGSYPGRLHVLKRPGKMGLGSAYLQGFSWALQNGSEALGQMDADFSHPPEKLSEFCQAIESHDVVLGSRYIKGGSLDEQWPLWRKNLSAFGNFYARTILGLPIHDVTGGFRLWRREVLEQLPLERVRSNGYVFQVEMAYLAHRLGYSFCEIPFHFADRRWGKSKMSFRISLEAAFRVWLLLIQYRDLDKAVLLKN